MRIVKLAAGLAIGYVLGARAGREQYEKIAEAARGLSGSPKVEQAKQKVKDTAGAKLDQVADKAGAPRKPRSPRSKPAGSTPAGSGTAGSGTVGTTPVETVTVESTPAGSSPL
ncbi:hypothetical protein ACQPZX_31930 [Actinoplanes sp. CA-142083]|uniref:hypothetical protein n=1 Tax=Actinoplanes sp. CA-142083 TaxID=3239903 RepID=UPI003D8F03D7